jgi:hypothetical protein
MERVRRRDAAVSSVAGIAARLCPRVRRLVVAPGAKLSKAGAGYLNAFGLPIGEMGGDTRECSVRLSVRNTHKLRNRSLLLGLWVVSATLLVNCVSSSSFYVEPPVSSTTIIVVNQGALLEGCPSCYGNGKVMCRPSFMPGVCAKRTALRWIDARRRSCRGCRRLLESSWRGFWTE